MEGTLWAFVPAIVAIVLALITKQVYISLFIGVLTGALLYAGGNPLLAMGTLYTVMAEKVGANVPIIVFLVILGIFVVLMQKSGGAQAYGNWAGGKIKSRKGALGMTAGLGCLIFMDDYFNCLTVGSVMRPLTDKYKVSRSKLAYIIDSTAAPVCIIAPISSWAAAVAGELEGDAILTFIKTIPFNVYAILTLVMVFTFIILKIDFGKMAKDQQFADITGDLNAGLEDLESENEMKILPSAKGKVRHLVIPIIVLILSCVGAMIYSGYYFNEVTGYGTVPQSSSVIEAFSKCDSGSALAIGSTFALIVVGIYYMIAKVVSFKDMMESIPQGFKTMVPAILILVFAWTISGIMGAKGGYLDAEGFVKTSLTDKNFPYAICPALFFLLAGAIAFATGTSWGTFGVLVPIAVTLLGADSSSTILIMTISATLGGAVFGDHVSPISDTTILASAGANSNHVNHVRTQLPYAAIVAIIAFVTYLASGFLATSSLAGWLVCLIMWAIVAIIFVGVVIVIKTLSKKTAFTDIKSQDESN